MAKVPCKDCSERSAECHSTCDKYREFQKQNEELKEKRRLQREADVYGEQRKFRLKTEKEKRLRLNKK